MTNLLGDHLPTSHANKYLLLTTLYFTQGVPFGFFTQALPTLMRERSYSLQLIGLSSLLALPWALKWIWAPLIDRWYHERWGRRRSWILPLQLCTALVLAVLAIFGETGAMLWVVVGCVVCNLLAATQDIATDGLAVELLSEHERGPGNGLQVAGYRAGMIVGGLGLALALDTYGWTPALSSMAVIVLVSAIPIALHRDLPSAHNISPESSSLRKFLRHPGVPAWLLALVVYKSGDALATGMMRPFLVDAGFGLSEIGVLFGGVGSVAGLLGALVGGWWTRRLGLRRALIVFGLSSAATIAGYAIVASASTTDLRLLSVVVGVEHFFGGTATVALFAAMMEFCRKGSEGNDYTIQASVAVISNGLAHSLSGFSADFLGYTLHFWTSAAVAVLATVASWVLLGRARQQGTKAAYCWE